MATFDDTPAPKIGNEVDDTAPKKQDEAGNADAATKDYDKKFNRTRGRLKNLERTAASTTEDTAAADDAASGSEDELRGTPDLKTKEAQPTTAASTVSRTTTASQDGHHSRPGIARSVLGKLRRGSAFGFIIGLVVLGVAYASVFAPNVILVNIKEMYTNDLADATVALHVYYKKMLDHKLGKADCGDKESIKCKLSTMSRNQVKAFERHGFTVNGEKLEEDNLDDRDPKNDKPESRWKVTSIQFPHGGGTATDGDSFEKAANKSASMKDLAYSVFNPRSSYFMDERFKTRIKEKFDLTKIPTVYGTTEKEVDESFNESLKGDDEGFDEAGRAGIGLNTLKTNKATDQLSKVAESIGKMANSYTQIQCAYYTQGKIVSNSAKTAREHTLARFAMQYLKAADQVKQGQSDEITANVLSSKLAWSDDGGYNSRNATDANIYRHIVLREALKSLDNGTKYTADAFDSIEGLKTPWDVIEKTAKDTKGITGAPGSLVRPPADLNSKPRDHCLHGQTTQSKSQLKPDKCPALTFAAAPPPIKGAVAGVAAASDRICPPPPKGIWRMFPPVSMTVPITMPYIANQFNEAIKKWADKKSEDFTADTKGIAASEAVFAGTGIVLGDMAMSRGMRPADEQSLTEYLNAGATIRQEYEQLAREQAKYTPFDVYNQYSFLGSIAKSLLTNHPDTTSVFGAATSLLGTLPTAVTKLSQQADAIYFIQPDEFDTGRLQCNDAEYDAIGIDADIACNVRYSMSKTELDADPKKVLEYMLQSHPEETDKGVQELQQRLGRTDFENDAADVSRQLSEARQGNQAKMIDEKTGDPVKHSEYDKFMQYCVNREDPWGRSAMAVQREELSEEEKEKRRQTVDENGTPRTSDYKGSPYEKEFVASYMSITEGTAGDQDWYTGKKCLEESEMLNNFRAYTMMCSVDGSLSGALDCTEKDDAKYYSDSFYTNNNILFTSWW